jgi:hypothetical protein
VRLPWACCRWSWWRLTLCKIWQKILLRFYFPFLFSLSLTPACRSRAVSCRSTLGWASRGQGRAAAVPSWPLVKLLRVVLCDDCEKIKNATNGTEVGAKS